MSDIYIKPSRDIAARMLDGEMIVMSVRDSTVYNLNPTASVIWSAADGSTPLREIVARKVADDSDLDAWAAYQDVREWVKELPKKILGFLDFPPIPQES